MKKYLFLSPAKLNLVLQVLGRREDGYHNIYTIFQKIDLFDEIEIKKGVPDFRLEFITKGINIPLEENLVYKAYVKFKQAFNLRENHHITIKKTIPIGAGLGGGSSNAATVLKGLAYIYGIDQQTPVLYDIAKELGADVPFFLSPYATALGEGIGEVLTPYPTFSAWYLLICPDFEISTKWAYQNLGLTKSKNPVYYSTEHSPWRQPQGLINDFKALVFEKFPFLKELEAQLKACGCCAVGLSGTGPTIFGVFEKELPFYVYEALKKKFRKVRVFLVQNLE
ncbi:4-(cytidine 5'-diphospho)-2-C-methyl-D-erythritol kinase [Thermodesulfobacterium sp. TA1]|uniref:4-(cytidine 5'-diphospho)-2-C-methyl-D-erythritol kinase n=1 Tax=Thermodesulfobacterium sp. TA1 TaxID=2234087 RepID=UPI00123190DB|nr:4-(cytidine 5'-diphospho)-2-C-methyl-D-erythritol kinase [Thermodesulfobacterium sp. TA1]QER41577.1 4-(cytidine 5'-diphospho)-2-C-methyl-D-erythritol kinase [Thermodesulfobacterium sp. TA1]